jgi:hypothetical protein
MSCKDRIHLSTRDESVFFYFFKKYASNKNEELSEDSVQ